MIDPFLAGLILGFVLCFAGIGILFGVLIAASWSVDQEWP